MAWIATFDISSDTADAVTGRLWDLGTTGVAETGSADGLRLLAGFDAESAAHAAATALGLEATIAPVDPSGWSTPAITTVEIAGHALAIDAQFAFGHGAHPTTRLCLDAVADHLAPGRSVLDVGTGSGVLAIAAAALGAAPVVAIDTDPNAVTSAIANAAGNGVHIDVSSTPVDAFEETFDLVVVNMLIAELEPIGPSLRRVLADGGTMIVSGCLPEQAGRVGPALRVAAEAELEVIERRELDGWVGLVLR